MWNSLELLIRWASCRLKDTVKELLYRLMTPDADLLLSVCQVREKLVVPMRMQWWRDGVNGIYKAKPIRHPVIQCLHQVLAHPVPFAARMTLLVSARSAGASINQLHRSSSQVNIRQPLTRYRLQKIINVREHDMLESDPPANIQALEEYAEGTASQLLQLQVVHLPDSQHLQLLQALTRSCCR